jgi:hypothetical protein
MEPELLGERFWHARAVEAHEQARPEGYAQADADARAAEAHSLMDAAEGPQCVELDREAVLQDAYCLLWNAPTQTGIWRDALARCLHMLREKGAQFPDG